MPTDSEEKIADNNQKSAEPEQKENINNVGDKKEYSEYDKKLDEIFNKFNNKIDEMSRSYEDKIKNLTDTINKKDEEIKKQKDITAQIILNSSTGKNDGKIDFANTDFDDVDWDKEAEKYMAKIDAKIHG